MQQRHEPVVKHQARKSNSIMVQDNNKMMDALVCRTIRGLVDNINSRGIRKEDIVHIVPSNGEYILLYYK